MLLDKKDENDTCIVKTNTNEHFKRVFIKIRLTLYSDKAQKSLD